jgi:hypothetical protein
MSEKKDIFDLFREESEQLTETPSTEAWQRLETRLAVKRKQKRKRRPLQLQLTIVSAIVGLLLVIGVVAWVAAKQHQDILRGQKQFKELYFLEGKWWALNGKVTDEWAWARRDSLLLTGSKSLILEDTLLTQTPVLLKNQGEINIFIFKNKIYKLREINNDTYSFFAKDGEEIRIRRQSFDRFTISFGEGVIFTFKRKQT